MRVERFIVHEVALAGADGHGHALMGYALQHREVGRGGRRSVSSWGSLKKIIGYSKTCCQVKLSLTTIQRFSITVNRFFEKLIDIFHQSLKDDENAVLNGGSYGRNNMRSRLAESVRSFHIHAARGSPTWGCISEQVTRYVNQSITGCGLSPSRPRWSAIMLSRRSSAREKGLRRESITYLSFVSHQSVVAMDDIRAP